MAASQNAAARVQVRAHGWIAVDCPSGLNAQMGTAAQACIRADETITMLAVKTGLLVPEAAPYIGRLCLALLKP